MKFDLQMFAEGETSGDIQGDTKTTDVDNKPADSNDAKQEMTADDIQSKIDAALAKTQAKWEAEFKRREELAKKEAERLSKLSDDERVKAELENTRRELDLQRAEFEAEKLRYETAQVVSKRGLPVEFTEYFIAEDSEKTLERIKTFEKKFNKAVEDAVNAKLKSKAPASSGTSIDTDNSGGVSESFMKAIFDNQIKR